MKIAIVLFIGIISFTQSIIYAQSDEYSDVVTLKNGNRVIGLITENIPNQHVTLKTKSGSVFTFNYGEIENIKKGGKDLIFQTPQATEQTRTDTTTKKDQGDVKSESKIKFPQKTQQSQPKSVAPGSKSFTQQSTYYTEESPWVYEFGVGFGLPYGVFGGRASVGNELITGDLGIGLVPLSWDPSFSLGGSLHLLDRYGTIRPKITALWSNTCGIVLLYDQGNSKVLFKEYYSGFAIYGGLDIKFSRDSDYSIDINIGSVFTSVSPAEMEEQFNTEKRLLEQRGYVFSSGSASFSNFPKFSIGISYIIGRSSETE